MCSESRLAAWLTGVNRWAKLTSCQFWGERGFCDFGSPKAQCKMPSFPQGHKERSQVWAMVTPENVWRRDEPRPLRFQLRPSFQSTPLIKWVSWGIPVQLSPFHHMEQRHHEIIKQWVLRWFVVQQNTMTLTPVKRILLKTCEILSRMKGVFPLSDFWLSLRAGPDTSVCFTKLLHVWSECSCLSTED